MAFSFSSSINTVAGQLFSDDSSDEELMGIMQECIDLCNEAESSRPQVITRQRVHRDRYGSSDRLFAHYFAEDAMYGPHHFRRRFRMSKDMFMRIVNDIQSYSGQPKSDHFIRMENARLDGRRKIGFTTIHKCVSAIRQLAYGKCPDSLDEYLQMGEETGRYVSRRFLQVCIRALFRRVFAQTNPTVG